MRYFLGFDGGGTKTECVLLGPSGKILARTVAGPSNPYRIGIAAAAGAIETAADSALREIGLQRENLTAMGAGLAGVGDAQRREQMRSTLQDAFPGSRIVILTDLEAALAAAGEVPAIVLIAGTGSSAIGCNARGEILREGGHGPRAGDEGSAFDIGRQAVSNAGAAWEATGRQTVLGQQILTAMGCASWKELQEKGNLAADQVYPKIFPLVAAAADGGDREAQEILALAAATLAKLAAKVHARLALGGDSFLLAKMGGTVGRSVFFDERLEAALLQALPNAKMGQLKFSPAEAAARAALS